ncbi:MAG: hypothetical protein V9E84_11485 [Trichococcus flocculiformis]
MLKQLARQLQLIGFDQVRGYLDAGQIAGGKMTETITAAAFIALRQDKGSADIGCALAERME